MKNHQNYNSDKISEAWNEPYQILPDAQIDQSWQKMYHKVSNGRSRRNYFTTGIVAAVLAIFFSTYFFLEVYNPVVHVTNLTQAHKEVNLPDGSLVVLKRGSELRYRENFRGTREVNLEGQAYFDVVKDSLKEFSVKTKGTTTTVLGTSFTVKGTPGRDDTRISLYTGKVTVSINGTKDSFDVVPGERLVYESGKISIETFETSLSFEAGNEYVDINHLELEKVFDFLEERFGYSFDKDSSPGTMRVTLRVNRSDSLDQILKLLSIINKTDYEVNHKTKRIQVLK